MIVLQILCLMHIDIYLARVGGVFDCDGFIGIVRDLLGLYFPSFPFYLLPLWINGPEQIQGASKKRVISDI